MGDIPDRRLKLHVGRFSKRIKTSEEDLLNTFSKYGNVSCIFFPYKRFCFIKFTRCKDAMKTLKAASESKIILHGRILSVSVALTESLKAKINSGKKKKSSTEKEKISGPTLIDKLNDDCLVQIFLHLPIDERLQMEEVCVRWQNVSKKAWYNIRKLEFNLYDEFSNCSNAKPDNIEKILVRCGFYLKSLILLMKCSSHMLIVIRKHCYNLTKIELEFQRCNVEHTKNLSKLKNLQSFELFADSTFSINCLQNLPKTVKHIQLGSERFSKNLNFSNIFNKFDALNSLGFGEYNLGIDAIKDFYNNQIITSLSLSSCDSEKDSLMLLTLSNLEDLDLQNNYAVDDIFLASFPTKFPKLKKLDVSNCYEISDEGVNELKNMANLESLAIRNIGGSVTDLSIGQLRGIKILDCGKCSEVRDPGVMQLIKNCPNLEYLDMTGTSITKKTLRLAIRVTKNRTNSVILDLFADTRELNFDVEEENDSPFLTIN